MVNNVHEPSALLVFSQFGSVNVEHTRRTSGFVKLLVTALFIYLFIYYLHNDAFSSLVSIASNAG
jgi:hypothetical protein